MTFIFRFVSRILLYHGIKTKRKIIKLGSVSQKKHNERVFGRKEVWFCAMLRLAFPQKKGVNRQSEKKRKAFRKDFL
ncbi:hypothetical protein B4901_12025 [Yersinia frederiksenii]|nr:hypothetical protein B4901_12025 [Yersinia frederiksenii]